MKKGFKNVLIGAVSAHTVSSGPTSDEVFRWGSPRGSMFECAKCSCGVIAAEPADAWTRVSAGNVFCSLVSYSRTVNGSSVEIGIRHSFMATSGCEAERESKTTL